MKHLEIKTDLPSHTRSKHDLEKEEVFEKMIEKDQEKEDWKILGGVVTIILAIIGYGKLK